MQGPNTISRSFLSFFIFFLIIGSSVTSSILKKSKSKLRIGTYEIGSFELKLMRGYDGFHLYHHKDYTTFYDVDKLHK
jgi:hypothetical protein